MAKFIEVFEFVLQPLEATFPGYLTLLDCFKIFNYHYPQFKYADAAKFSLKPSISQLLTAKLSTIPDLELFLKTVITKLFWTHNSISAEFITQIEPRMQLIIVLTFFIQALSKTGVLSRRFISFSLTTFKTTARLYEVILSSFYLADEGFLLAYEHFCADTKDDSYNMLSGLLGFFLWLCFESFTPTVSEFLHINIKRIDEILTLRADLMSFWPFSTLLKSILALNSRADQIALDNLRQFSVSGCEEHPLMGFMQGFLAANHPLKCQEVSLRVLERFGSVELVESYRKEFTDQVHVSIDFSLLLKALNSDLDQEDFNSILSAVMDESSDEFKRMIQALSEAHPERFLKAPTPILEILNAPRDVKAQTE